ncbi:MAG: hypothetical protein AVDCRST_MAG60-225 [uncultured Nocardioides sp.]|uniref:Uncharacterized protein n=1 Tax=uncultured Nocardioides sp. TaxID=198441 RepID=A0A6J4MYQ8_9ACTN|nr:MAG: hypothetical protein AVDCRST_MAG60-225 [uncultured Nocardioides sp.]
MVLVCWPSLVACGAGSSARDEAGPETDAVRAELVTLFAGDHPGEDSTEAGECFADELLDDVSPEQLRDGGVLDEQLDVNREVTALDRPVAESWTDAQLACTDFIAESTKAQVDLTKGKLDTSKYTACLEGRLDAETVRTATVAALMADWSDPAVEDLSVAQSVCSRTSLQPS